MIVRLAVDASCKDKYTCPAVFADTEDPANVWVVGATAPPPDGVLVGDGEFAVKVPLQVVADSVGGLAVDTADTAGKDLA